MNELIQILTHNWIGVTITLILVMLALNFATGKLEDELSIIGKKLKIPTSVRGATFDAISSSLPELLTAFTALMILKEAGLVVAIGTVSGSAIFNILIIPFFALLYYKSKGFIKVEKSGVKRDTIFYIASVIMFIAGLFFGELLLMSMALIGIYVIYILHLFIESKINYSKNKIEVNKAYNDVKNQKVSYWTIFYTLTIVAVGVELAVHGADFIGKELNISPLIMALVLLAAVTSIPDTMLSVKASKKGDIDASLSNAVGSNIFDVCIGLGLPIFIGVQFMGLDPKVNFSEHLPIFIFLIIAVVLYYFVLNSKKLNRKSGIGLIAFYIIFIIYLILKTTGLI